MSTHAEEVARLRDAVVEAAKATVAADREWEMHLDSDASNRDEWGARCAELHKAANDAHAVNVSAVTALIAAEALTCPACKGHGRISMQPGPGARGVLFGVCPACHGTGRKPDTFRDDGATTPEGCEDERQGEVPGA